jgi:hypothetical protein
MKFYMTIRCHIPEGSYLHGLKVASAVYLRGGSLCRNTDREWQLEGKFDSDEDRVSSTLRIQFGDSATLCNVQFSLAGIA